MKLALPQLSGRSLAPSLAALALAATASPAPAADFSFHQADWLSDFSGFTSQNSDWGQVDIHFSNSDLSAFRFDPSDSTYSGFVNVVTNVQNGASMNWAVQNLPVQFRGLDSFTGTLDHTVMFDLGNTAGVKVTGLGYMATIDMDPRDVAPTGGFAAAGVDNVSVLFGGVSGTDPDTGETFLGGSGRNAPPKAENFKGADAGETQGKAGQIAGKEADIEKIDEDKMGCVPGGVARSIKYLEAQHPGIGNGDTAKDIYDGLKQKMGTQTGDGAAGTQIDNIKPGKDAYTKKKTLPIKTEKNGGIANAVNALNQKKDVEIILKLKGQGGHCAFVSKIVPIMKGKRVDHYVITIIDDPTQGNHKAENRSSDLTVQTNGTITSAGNFSKVDTFFIETAAPEPSSLVALLAGGVCLLALAVRRRKLAA